MWATDCKGRKSNALYRWPQCAPSASSLDCCKMGLGSISVKRGCSPSGAIFQHLWPRQAGKQRYLDTRKRSERVCRPSRVLFGSDLLFLCLRLSHLTPTQSVLVKGNTECFRIFAAPVDKTFFGGSFSPLTKPTLALPHYDRSIFTPLLYYQDTSNSDIRSKPHSSANMHSSGSHRR